MYLFFDTETNGLPKTFGAHWRDVNNWPRMTQLAFLLIDENEKEIESFSELINPDGWTIPKTQFFIDNNMSTERCRNEGVQIDHALDHFHENILLAKYKIAHNISFDNAIIGSETARLGLTNRMNETYQAFKEKPGICTMHKSTKFCALPKPSGRAGYKWPKLEELYMHLFNKVMIGTHDALYDIKATAKCFFELKKLGIIN